MVALPVSEIIAECGETASIANSPPQAAGADDHFTGILRIENERSIKRPESPSKVLRKLRIRFKILCVAFDPERASLNILLRDLK